LPAAPARYSPSRSTLKVLSFPEPRRDRRASARHSPPRRDPRAPATPPGPDPPTPTRCSLPITQPSLPSISKALASQPTPPSTRKVLASQNPAVTLEHPQGARCPPACNGAMLSFPTSHRHNGATPITKTTRPNGRSAPRCHTPERTIP